MSEEKENYLPYVLACQGFIWLTESSLPLEIFGCHHYDLYLLNKVGSWYAIYTIGYIIPNS